MQFGFMPGKGICFVDLEKAFDKSPKRGGEMCFEEAGCG